MTEAASPETPFELYRQFNGRPNARRWTGSRNRLGPIDAEHFPADNLQCRLARALCERSAVPIKELFEAAETFARARKRFCAPRVADVCCGHGLTGALFAVFEKDVERVELIDRARPRSADAVLAAVAEVAPWAVLKLHWRVAEVRELTLDGGTDVVAVHACGFRTDDALEAGLASGGAVALLPCCRPHRLHPAPDSLKRALGGDVAIDAARTMRMEAAGLRTAWRAIPSEISVMNRLLVGWPRRA